MFTYTRNRFTSCLLIYLITFTILSCTKQRVIKIADNGSPHFSTTSSSAKNWLIGVWKENGSRSLKGPDISYSWGMSKFDEAAFAVDLAASPPIISSYGVEFIVEGIKQDGALYTFSLIDSSGHVRETLSISIEADGTINFPDKTQKTILLINLNKRYHKVDGPNKDWSVMH
jgi:hypothetical protein